VVPVAVVPPVVAVVPVVVVPPVVAVVPVVVAPPVVAVVPVVPVVEAVLAVPPVVWFWSAIVIALPKMSAAQATVGPMRRSQETKTGEYCEFRMSNLQRVQTRVPRKRIIPLDGLLDYSLRGWIYSATQGCRTAPERKTNG